MTTKTIICSNDSCSHEMFEVLRKQCETCYFNQAVDISKATSVIIAGEPVNIKAEEDDDDKN